MLIATVMMLFGLLVGVVGSRLAGLRLGGVVVPLVVLATFRDGWMLGLWIAALSELYRLERMRPHGQRGFDIAKCG